MSLSVGSSSTNNPYAYIQALLQQDQSQGASAQTDPLSALFAARGRADAETTYFTLSKPGTVDVDAKTGADAWSDAKDSGHYVLTNAASDETFAALLDGYAHTTGLLAKRAASALPPSTPGEASPGVPLGGSSR